MRNASWLLVVSFFFLLDQFTKLLALSFAPPCVQQAGVFCLIFNSGAAFGILSGFNTVLLLLSILASLILLYALHTVSSRFDKWGASFVLAGVLGNGLDRVLHGAVVDFIRIGSWPVFNVADMCIVCGVCLLLLQNSSSKSSKSSK